VEEETTTAEEVTTTAEQEITTVEEETTTAEEVTTTAEEVTTTAEQETTTVEEETTTAEEVTTTAEQETTTLEEETTTAEAVTTTAEDMTTTAEENTSTAADLTTTDTEETTTREEQITKDDFPDFDVVCHESQDGYAVYVPHPTQCNLYYQCVGLTPILLHCPGELFFDPILKVCNWPNQVDCEDKTTKADQETPITTTMGEESTTVMQENARKVFKRSIDPDFDVVCPPSADGSTVFVPHPTDCNLYYICVGKVPFLMQCPGDLYFDSVLNVCNWPDMVECEPKTTENPETTSIGNEKTTANEAQTTTNVINSTTIL